MSIRRKAVPPDLLEIPGCSIETWLIEPLAAQRLPLPDINGKKDASLYAPPGQATASEFLGYTGRCQH